MTTTVSDISAEILRFQPYASLARLQIILFLAASEFSALTLELLFPEPMVLTGSGPMVGEVVVGYGTDPVPGSLNDVEKCCVESVWAKYGKLSDTDIFNIVVDTQIFQDCRAAGFPAIPLTAAQFRQTGFAQATPVELPDDLLDRFFGAINSPPV